MKAILLLVCLSWSLPSVAETIIMNAGDVLRLGNNTVMCMGTEQPDDKWSCVLRSFALGTLGSTRMYQRLNPAPVQQTGGGTEYLLAALCERLGYRVYFLMRKSVLGPYDGNF